MNKKKNFIPADTLIISKLGVFIGVSNGDVLDIQFLATLQTKDFYVILNTY